MQFHTFGRFYKTPQYFTLGVAETVEFVFARYGRPPKGMTLAKARLVSAWH
jgi:hypothetical protein